MRTGSAHRANWLDHLRLLRRLVNRIEAAQVRRFGHSVLSLAFRTPVLVVTTTGRRSGRRRDTPLAYVRPGDDQLLVVGGAAGQVRLPDWVANVRANAAVEVTLDRVTRPMQASELQGTPRERAWRLAVETWPRVEAYEARAARPVPVVILRPRPPTPPSRPPRSLTWAPTRSAQPGTPRRRRRWQQVTTVP